VVVEKADHDEEEDDGIASKSSIFGTGIVWVGLA